MSCGRYRRMILLNRPGELPKSESEELANHLAGCAECAAFLNQDHRADRFLEKIRQSVPVLTRPEELLESIVGQISSPAEHYRMRGGENRFKGLLEVVLSPVARFGSAALAVVTVVLFLFQAGSTFHSLSLLEGKLEVQKGSHRGPEVAYRVNTDAAREDPALQLLPWKAASEFGLQTSGTLLVAQRVITQFTGGVSPGPIEMVQLASMLRSDPARLRSALRAIERHATPVVLF